MLHGVAEGAVHETLRAEVADRLHADADLDGHVALRRADGLELRLPLPRRFHAAEAHFLEFFGKFLREKIQHLLCFR